MMSSEINAEAEKLYPQNQEMKTERAGSTSVPATSAENPPSLRIKPDCGGKNPADKEKISFGAWTEVEHRRFMAAMEKYGNDWTKVCDAIGTRTTNQARSHAQKFFGKRRKQAIDKAVKNGASKKMIFAITREYVNRTAIKSSIELIDVPSRLPKKKKIEELRPPSYPDVVQPLPDVMLRI